MRSWRRALRAVRAATLWPAVLCLLRAGAGEAAPEALVNCNEVMIEDRCACNERILRALTNMRAIVPETEGSSWTAAEIRSMKAIQDVRQDRLRSFLVPDPCDAKDGLSPSSLPRRESHTTYDPHREWLEKSLQPARTREIDSSQKVYPLTRKLLVGRWEGWQTLFGSKPTRVAFHVISVGGRPLPLHAMEKGTFVRACSDQGMVIGQLRGGYLELPRLDAAGGAYAIRLWESTPPRSRELEGVALFEVRPGEMLVAGLVWLSRVVSFDWTTPPSSYFCQDRDLEEQRRNIREEQAEHPR